MKADLSLSELEKAAQAPGQSEVELQRDVEQQHWCEFTICDAVWHIRDAWGEVMQSCIRRLGRISIWPRNSRKRG